MKASLKYKKEQMSLIIKGQDNDVIPDLCQKHFYQVIIVPHNLTNRFQPFDIIVNKSAKLFVSNKYNGWFSMQVSQQLEKIIQPVDVQVSLSLTELKVMHANWILELYN